MLEETVGRVHPPQGDGELRERSPGQAAAVEAPLSGRWGRGERAAEVARERTTTAGPSGGSFLGTFLGMINTELSRSLLINIGKVQDRLLVKRGRHSDEIANKNSQAGNAGGGPKAIDRYFLTIKRVSGMLHRGECND